MIVWLVLNDVRGAAPRIRGHKRDGLSGKIAGCHCIARSSWLCTVEKAKVAVPI
jgi:hypothetical protein